MKRLLNTENFTRYSLKSQLRWAVILLLNLSRKTLSRLLLYATGGDCFCLENERDVVVPYKMCLIVSETSLWKKFLETISVMQPEDMAVVVVFPVTLSLFS